MTIVLPQSYVVFYLDLNYHKRPKVSLLKLCYSKHTRVMEAERRDKQPYIYYIFYYVQ